jgi:transketolase
MKNRLIGSRKLIQRRIVKLKRKAALIRRNILELSIGVGAGHIAPSFSCIEILTVLYHGGILRVNPRYPASNKRNRFILSKGHASIALYVVLADLGFFAISELDGFMKDGSRLGGHADTTIPGVETFTGSLGHGLSIGAGLALAAKMDKKKYTTFVLMGDGECHEGSIWEAAMFASHQRLNNLVAIIDHNGLSATNFLKDCLEVEPLNKKWQAFGWDVTVINGHSFTSLLSVLNKVRFRTSPNPLVVIALTTKGKGISFMENNPIWHYRIPVEKELDIARRELAQKYR